jgi:secondary thiamine-phosphate synthase enzyme
MITTLEISTSGQGLVDITSEVSAQVARLVDEDGLCTLFIRHTSASLLIQENADPSARRDLEAWMNRLVPENDPLYRHVLEGPDDMPAHIKSMLTQTSLSVPVQDGRLMLGTWQGIFHWEHRRGSHRRTIILHLSPDS